MSGPEKALLLVGHGSTKPDNRRVVETHAERLREIGAFDEVQTCFVLGEPNVDGAMEEVEADTVTVVPVFISHGVHTREDIPEALNFETTEKDVTYAEPLGDDPGVTEIIMERAGALQRVES